MTTELDVLVDQYLARHPDYELPEPRFRRPAVLAMLGDLKLYLLDRLGGPLPFWTAVLRSAQAAFHPGEASDAYRLFRTLFEAEGNIWWNGIPELDALSREYNRWRLSLKQDQGTHSGY